METDKDHIHFLIEYDTIDRFCDIVKVIKQETTHIIVFFPISIGKRKFFGLMKCTSAYTLTNVFHKC